MKFPLHDFVQRHQGNLLAVLMVGTLFAIPAIALFWLTAVPGDSHKEKLPALTSSEKITSSNLSTHISAIASKPHNIGHMRALEASAIYIEEQLSA